MVPVDFIKEKINRIHVEIELEKNLRNKELLEERVLVLEELLSEVIKSENK